MGWWIRHHLPDGGSGGRAQHPRAAIDQLIVRVRLFMMLEVRPHLETPRLLLRPLALADADQIQQIFPQWDVVRYLSRAVPWPYPADGALTFVRDYALPAVERGEQWIWTLRLKSDPERLIGLIALMTTADNNRGFWMDPRWQRRGLMTEACERVTDYWFTALNFPALRVPKAAANVGSRRISEKQGMRLVITEERDYVSGRLPAEVWEITAEEWIERRQQQIRAAHVGLPKPLNGPILIVDYDPGWPELFAREAARVRAVLAGLALRIEHVGSTSVPGLGAKPIIDMVLVVPDSADERAYVPLLEAAGYRLHIREVNWYEHRMFKGRDTDINLHTFSVGCPEIDRMLLFRDWLLVSTADRELYARAKFDLAQRKWQFGQNYADAKGVVIDEIMARARGFQSAPARVTTNNPRSDKPAGA